MLKGSTVRTLAVLCVLALPLSGCLGWDELPDGATGFLIVEAPELSGTVGGVAIERGSTTTSGAYCTEDGWRMNMHARLVDGEELTTVVQMRDLDMRDRETTVRFVQRGDLLEIASGREAGQLKLATCVGDEAAPVLEQDATEVEVSMNSTSRDSGFGTTDDVSFQYTADFENGDQVNGRFNMEMPVVD